mmetsp:Transcript_14081/g.23366  ORF Transcript_14081/g.23366 Transcript_14081/m.23366 type:complete len:478 (-) Transcript_14081:152-1585(-)
MEGKHRLGRVSSMLYDCLWTCLVGSSYIHQVKKSQARETAAVEAPSQGAATTGKEQGAATLSSANVHEGEETELSGLTQSVCCFQVCPTTLTAVTKALASCCPHMVLPRTAESMAITESTGMVDIVPRERSSNTSEMEEAASLEAEGTAQMASRAAKFRRALSPEVRAALEMAWVVFKEAGGKEDPCTDVLLARFCMQNELNEKKIAAHLRRAIAWRKHVQADIYRTTFIAGRPLLSFPSVEHWFKFVSCYATTSFTQRGEMLHYINLVAEPAEFMIGMTDKEFCEGNLAFNEFLLARADRCTLERDVEQPIRLCAVTDVSYMSRSHLSFSVMHRFQLTANWGELYYPLLLERSIVLNVPKFVVTTWKLLRMTFSEEYRSRFFLFPKPADGDSPCAAFLTLISPDLLPLGCGGTLRMLKPEDMHLMGFDLFDDDKLKKLCPTPGNKGTIGQLHLPPKGMPKGYKQIILHGVDGHLPE